MNGLRLLAAIAIFFLSGSAAQAMVPEFSTWSYEDHQLRISLRVEMQESSPVRLDHFTLDYTPRLFSLGRAYRWGLGHHPLHLGTADVTMVQEGFFLRIAPREKNLRFRGFSGGMPGSLGRSVLVARPNCALSFIGALRNLPAMWVQYAMRGLKDEQLALARFLLPKWEPKIPNHHPLQGQWWDNVIRMPAPPGVP